MARPVVLCTQAMHEFAQAMLRSEAEIIAPADTRPASLDALLPRADYLVVRNHLRPGFLDQPHRLRGIVRHGTGLDMVPVDDATRQGIPVANVPGANAQAVAEYIVGSFFALARRFAGVDRTLRGRGWQEARRAAGNGTELAGRTVGIVGVGNIGRRVAAMCSGGLGMRVVGHHPRAGGIPGGVESVSLDVLLDRSDFVTLCCPLTPDTRGLLGAAQFARMKPTAFLVNAARGELADEAALADALRRQAIAGAAIDVYAQQPLAADHPFLDLGHVLLTPHVASSTEDSAVAMGTGTARQVLQLMRGERPEHMVNGEVWEGWLERHARDRNGEQLHG